MLEISSACSISTSVLLLLPRLPSAKCSHLAVEKAAIQYSGKRQHHHQSQQKKADTPLVLGAAHIGMMVSSGEDVIKRQELDAPFAARRMVSDS
jgi:hypothetical protein